VHIPEVNKPDIVILSEKCDGVVATPDVLPEISAGFLDIVLKLRDLRLVGADAWQLLLNFFPGKSPVGILGKRSCGVGDDEYKPTFVCSGRGPMFADDPFNE
jgi:hypothetical protein